LLNQIIEVDNSIVEDTIISSLPNCPHERIPDQNQSTPLLLILCARNNSSQRGGNIMGKDDQKTQPSSNIIPHHRAKFTMEE
jgi:hypothetical protein